MFRKFSDSVVIILLAVVKKIALKRYIKVSYCRSAYIFRLTNEIWYRMCQRYVSLPYFTQVQLYVTMAVKPETETTFRSGIVFLIHLQH